VALEAHATCEVISAVEVSEYVPVAVNCFDVPRTSVSELGATEICVSVGVGTTSVTPALVTPSKVTVIVVEPTARAVARPVLEMDATVDAELAQVAVDVTTTVELSLYFAVALN
jgi:hypothetical protein